MYASPLRIRKPCIWSFLHSRLICGFYELINIGGRTKNQNNNVPRGRHRDRDRKLVNALFDPNAEMPAIILYTMSAALLNL
jgi:hypothetical protein